MTEVKIEIPITIQTPEGSSQRGGEGTLVGILRRQDGSQPSSSSRAARPITLILHGVLAHKDQLFHRKLAQSLPLDSFRFDFRHAVDGGESRDVPGSEWHMSSFDQDVLDIHFVVRHLRHAYNYHVESIVAHSRGTLNTWHYYWDVEMRRAAALSNRTDDFILDRIPFYVAIAGRWDMQRMRKRFPDDLQDFRVQGYHEWKVRVAGKNFSVKVTKEMVDKFAEFPQAKMVDQFPFGADCLLLHGSSDGTVPFQDAYAYLDKLQANMQPPRRPESTQLQIIDGADHTFKGHFDDVVQASCAWLADRRRRVIDGENDASPIGREFNARCPLPSLQTAESGGSSVDKNSRL